VEGFPPAVGAEGPAPDVGASESDHTDDDEEASECDTDYVVSFPPDNNTVIDKLPDPGATDEQLNAIKSDGKGVITLPDLARVDPLQLDVLESYNATYRAKPLNTYIPGGYMSAKVLVNAAQRIMNHWSSVRAPGRRVIFLMPWQWATLALREHHIPDDFDGFCFGVMHLTDPEHWVSVMWSGGRRFEEVWVSDGMKTDHQGLRRKLAEAGVTRFSVRPGTKMETFRPLGLTCGVCVLSDFAASLANPHGVWSSTPCFSPCDLASDDAFDAVLVKVFAPSPRFHRETFIRVITPDDRGTAGFPAGTLGLQRVPMTLEAAKRLTKNKTVRGLLTTEWFLMPTNEDILKALSNEQRRKHLYVLSDVLRAITTAGNPRKHRSLAVLMIEGLQSLSIERKWSAPTTLVNMANALFGALTRLDQYTCLKAVNMSENSHWKDAMRTWQKNALGHLPHASEVSLEAVKEVIPKLSLPAQMVLIVAWFHTGRPGNVFSLHTEDVYHLTHLPDRTAKWSVMWQRGKTVLTRGPFTTSSWIPEEYVKLLNLWRKSKPRQNTDLDKWFLPVKDKRRLLNEVLEELKKVNPQWGLRALRRGSLSTMARNGTPLETLQTFSGHKDVPMLLRYLKWGLHAADRADKGAKAARSAFQKEPQH
jgi:hypothetical protein